MFCFTKQTEAQKYHKPYQKWTKDKTNKPNRSQRVRSVIQVARDQGARSYLVPGSFRAQGARESVTREILIPWSLTLDLRSGSLDPVWFVCFVNLVNLVNFVKFVIKSIGFMAFLRLGFKTTLSLWHS